ncbi:hypothetical protein KUTeg_008246 [Tegillarca granosa]|uniref:Chitin-binding type-2 domain-containing protein n=1 Tax=Tegillarca granosa TaxID=220873 RepID=A0ABQ9F8M0_TEGGR|nr:hypothetical protein KUTeg_008246 [Tegillarca granosa]
MQHFSQTMVTFDVYHFRFLLSISIMQGLSAFPVGDNTLPVDFPHASKLKGLLSDMCFGSQKRIVPHPEDCALYYNCSSIYRVIPLYMEQNLHECPYPKLFSTETNQCEMFHRVECGKRKEPKWEKHWCRDDECLTPCASKYPSCIGKSDGLNPFRDGQSMLPYYLECEDERVVKIKICPRVPILTRFSPLTKRCEALYRIPIEYSKINTICKMKGDGYHADTFGRCKNYFRCTNGSFESFETCLGTQLFDQKRRVCAKPETICGRCDENGRSITTETYYTYVTGAIEHIESVPTTQSNDPDFSKTSKLTTQSSVAELNETTEQTQSSTAESTEHKHSSTTESTDHKQSSTAETTKQTKSSSTETTEHTHSSTTETTEQKQSSTAETTERTQSTATETTEHT